MSAIVLVGVIAWVGSIAIAYALGHNHGFVEGLAQGAETLQAMRERATRLLARSRIKYTQEELDDLNREQLDHN